MRIIFLDIEPGDFALACRVARYQLMRTDGGRDAILSYGENGPTKDFYVKRNKASITVRYCGGSAG